MIGQISASNQLRTSPELAPNMFGASSELAPNMFASRVQHISDLHFEFALRPHHVWKYVRPLRLGEEKKKKEEEERKKEDEGNHRAKI